MRFQRMTRWAAVWSVVIAATTIAAAQSLEDVDQIIARAKLVQEIDCAKPNKELLFLEYPAGASTVRSLLGQDCRVLPNDRGDAKYFAYRIGEGKGLKPGARYILTVDYPEDLSRAMYVGNWGCETLLGFATGQAVGDVLKGKYVPNNPESLKYPLSGKMQRWTQVFNLHDRTPEIKRPRGLGIRALTADDGFWVIIAQPAAMLDPMSAGAAVSKIRLYELSSADAAAASVKIHFPQGLPHRHIFSREEMADGAVAFGHKPEEQAENMRGVKNITDWYEYKMNVMSFLGVDTFSKDLLEFGHNQGWDSTDGGGNDWVYQSSTPWLWEQILDRVAKHPGMSVLPMYEYRGSVGGSDKALGSQHLCRRLDGGETYTHIQWCEGRNVDIVNPAAAADFNQIVDLTITKYKNKVSFVGAWVRQRPTAMPMSYNDYDLRQFSAQANDGNRITRSHLQADAALLKKYNDWWFGQRRQFFNAVRDHLRKQVSPNAVVLFTADASEPGIALQRRITGEGRPNGWEWMQVVVNDDMDAWTPILSDDKYKYIKPYAEQTVIDQNIHERSLELPAENWDAKWDMAASIPPADPRNYHDSDGVLLTYTYNRMYTVGSPKPFDDFRTKSGLAIMRHYSLNENEMSVGNDELLGYCSVDVERAGPYCMMAEARAMAFGDPYYLGSLTGGTSNRGFPQFVRNFNANFLALPALPSTVVSDAVADAAVVVRRINTPGNGTYFALVNTSFDSKTVTITLPTPGQPIDAVTGQPIPTDAGKLKLDFHPAQLRAIRVQ